MSDRWNIREKTEQYYDAIAAGPATTEEATSLMTIRKIFIAYSFPQLFKQ